MADPLFDNLTRTIRGDAAPATMRHWIGKNLVLDAVTGFDSENLKLAAWFTELRAIFCGGPDDFVVELLDYWCDTTGDAGVCRLRG